MAKFSNIVTKFSNIKPAPRKRATAPTKVTGTRLATHEGGTGYAKDDKTALYTLAVTNMVTEPTFYESGKDRDDRFRTLVRRVTTQDPTWVTGFIGFLRNEANMRSASIVVAAEAAKTLLDLRANGVEVEGNVRSIIASACERADEPAEMLGYWLANYGRALPMGVKRGIGDAAVRLYTERNALKYDGKSRGVRMGDVLNLTHPTPSAAWQSDLFRYLLDRRHGHANGVIPETLTTILAATELDKTPENQRRALLRKRGPEALANAGYTWERLSGWLPGGMDAEAWEAIIPSMGYMACLAAGTPILLPDGTSAPIEDVVARRLPVMSPDRPFDTRSVRYGPSQPGRDSGMGEIVPTIPSAWHSMGVRPVVMIEFSSGRTIEATLDHRWVNRRRNDRRESWQWITTADLSVGDRLPIPVGVEAWGDMGDSFDGYFVGPMLGDGCMTNHGTPEFAQVNDPTRAEIFAFMEDYAAKFGCEFKAAGERKWRITFPDVRKMNPVTDVLRSYEVWGLRSNEKKFPNLPLSREFWIGAISGLIDTAGHVRLRRNPKGTLHASVEYATISEIMVRQVQDALQRLGIDSSVVRRTSRAPRTGLKANDIFILSINKAASIKRAADLLILRHTEKRSRLDEAAAVLPETPISNVEMDRIVAISEPYEAEVYCVTVDSSSTFVAGGLITGNCLRNLRNFEQAKVKKAVLKSVANRLADPEAVAKSRQFPYRFFLAWKESGSTFFGPALEAALDESVKNLPIFSGRTLVAIDTSASMRSPVSGRSKAQCYEVGALFGTAVAARSDCDVILYADRWEWFTPEVSVLRSVEKVRRLIGEVGYGTNTWPSVAQAFADKGGYDRIVVLTDCQDHPARGGLYGHRGTSTLPDVPIYVWDLRGYKATNIDNTPGRYLFGGFSDAAFKMIALIERGQNAEWPWLD